MAYLFLKITYKSYLRNTEFVVRESFWLLKRQVDNANERIRQPMHEAGDRSNL